MTMTWQTTGISRTQAYIVLGALGYLLVVRMGLARVIVGN